MSLLDIAINALQSDIKDDKSFSTLLERTNDVYTQLQLASGDDEDLNATISATAADSVYKLLKATLQYLTDHPDHIPEHDSSITDPAYISFPTIVDNIGLFDLSSFSYLEYSTNEIQLRTDDVAYVIKAMEFFGFIVTAGISVVNTELLYTTVSNAYTVSNALKTTSGYVYDADGIIKQAYNTANSLKDSATLIIPQETLADTSIATEKTTYDTALSNFDTLVMTDSNTIGDGINTIFRFTLPLSDTKVTFSELVDFSAQVSQDFHSEIKIVLKKSQSGLMFDGIVYSTEGSDDIGDGKDGDGTNTASTINVDELWLLKFKEFVVSGDETHSGLVVNQISGPSDYGLENRNSLHALIEYLFNVASGATIKSDVQVESGFKNIIGHSFDKGVSGIDQDGNSLHNGVFWSLHNSLLNAGRMQDGHVVMETTDMIELVCPIRSDDPDVGNSTDGQENYWNLSINFLFET